MIDRFGRVFNVVAESDAANHAGTSVWADNDGVYVNLNDSFLGVSFEGQTGAADEVTPAQIASAKVLTEMLRSRYGIRRGELRDPRAGVDEPVQHANRRAYRLGGQIPIRPVGLPDNYSPWRPPASTSFGFEYDSVFLRAAAGTLEGAGCRGSNRSRQQAEARACARRTIPRRPSASLQRDCSRP